MEFDNVLILLTKKFGRDKEYFSSLLKTFPEKTDAKYDSTEIGAARNLFYVAVTRATKKLCVAYLADEQEQLSLFDFTENSSEIIEKIKRQNVDNMTAREALNFLWELKDSL